MHTYIYTIIISFILGILTSLLASIIFLKLKYLFQSPWSSNRRKTLKPSLKGANQLKYLMDLLDRVYSWLSKNETEIILEICDNIWKAIIQLSIERFVYLAMYSPNLDQQLDAINKLAQISDRKIRIVLDNLMSSPTTIKSVKIYTEQLLDKLQLFEDRDQTDADHLSDVNLLPEARILLIEASQDLDGIVIYTRTFDGTDFQTNKKNLCQDQSARSVARWKSALDMLVTYGLLEERGHNGEVFALTDRGFEVADLLRGNTVSE